MFDILKGSMFFVSFGQYAWVLIQHFWSTFLYDIFWQFDQLHARRYLFQFHFKVPINLMISDSIPAGLSKFARLARSVTRNRSVLLQFSPSMPNTKMESSKPSQIANVSIPSFLIIWHTHYPPPHPSYHLQTPPEAVDYVTNPPLKEDSFKGMKINFC